MGISNVHLPDATITALGTALGTPISTAITDLGALVTASTATQLFQNAGAPVDGTTLAGKAIKGSFLVDTTNNVVYVNTNTLASPTWSLVNAANIQNVCTPGNAVTLKADVLNTLAVGSTAITPVISLPAASTSSGHRFRLYVDASATRTYSFSTNSSTGVQAKFWTGGSAPTYSTTAVGDYFEGISNGVAWIGTIAIIGITT